MSWDVRTEPVTIISRMPVNGVDGEPIESGSILRACNSERNRGEVPSSVTLHDHGEVDEEI